MSSYFAIHSGEDGGSCEKLSKAELIERINEEYWGKDVEFEDHIPNDQGCGEGMEYWGNKMIIIKGEIVTPEPVEFVKSYDIK